MAVTLAPQLLVVSFGGVVGGLGLLVRGMQGYRRETQIADVATSRIATIAAGEVRISGTVEPAELLLVSPLQSADCVYYRAHVQEAERNSSRTVIDEERAVGFVVRDESGVIRVFPRGAAWDVPARLDDRDGALGDSPPGLLERTGPPMKAARPDRDDQVAALLGTALARQPASARGPTDRTASESNPLDGQSELASAGVAAAPAFGLDDLVLLQSGGFGGHGRRHYVESRIEPGDTVTIVGSAVPFGSLGDPDDADLGYGDAAESALGELDPEVAADVAAARESGSLAASPEAAWGNAAIPGFGIGRPVRAPTLDPGAHAVAIATAAEAATFRRTFEIAPEALVVARLAEAPLLVSAGAPGQAEARNQGQFLLGLAGAVLAIASAVAIAVQLGGVGT